MLSINKYRWSEWLWDIWCVISVIGIWPRFIEPNLLVTTRLYIDLPKLPLELDGLKVLQLSDLHWGSENPLYLSRRILNRIQNLKPDLIVFTGDFICRSEIDDESGLYQFLSNLKAPLGCFAVLGNHDYDSFLTVNEAGEYDTEVPSLTPNIVKGFKRLFGPLLTLTGKFSEKAKNVKIHNGLSKLLKKTPVVLLHNETKTIQVKNSFINITGLAEYMTGQFDSSQSFMNYDNNIPGIVLAHNPDSISYLKDCPGDLILSGHTHGGQINLPWMWRKFTLMENPEFKRGLKKINNKWLYINRGIGGLMKFRWFSPPELTLITLRSVSNKLKNSD